MDIRIVVNFELKKINSGHINGQKIKIFENSGHFSEHFFQWEKKNIYIYIYGMFSRFWNVIISLIYSFYTTRYLEILFINFEWTHLWLSLQLRGAQAYYQ